MANARITARQVAESLSVQELREAAKEFRVKPEEATAEDIAQLLEYIADLRDWPNYRSATIELLKALEDSLIFIDHLCELTTLRSQRVQLMGGYQNIQAAICKAKGGQQ